jgi:hypothetical protein
VRLDKKDVARLLEGVPDPEQVGLWPVAVKYRILGRWIYVDNPQPIFEEDPEIHLELEQPFADSDLFFSFARLGARGEPSEKASCAGFQNTACWSERTKRREHY